MLDFLCSLSQCSPLSHEHSTPFSNEKAGGNKGLSQASRECPLDLHMCQPLEAPDPPMFGLLALLPTSVSPSLSLPSVLHLFSVVIRQPVHSQHTASVGRVR